MKKLLILLILSISFIPIFAQNISEIDFANEKLQERGEIYFKFAIPSQEILNQLSKIISIDNVDYQNVFAYANEIEFQQFLEFHIPFIPMYDYYTHKKATTMATVVSEMANWDRYPTFSVYCEMLKNYATNYPNLCRLDTIGFSAVANRPILCLVISDNVNQIEDEPNFFWSSTMHGDELTGLIMSMRLADYLLLNYNIDNQVNKLINNSKIFICPMANPDGTYAGSPQGTNVINATRYNANNIDLNRNFPRIDGISTSIQSEISCMMDYANIHNFTMSANLHGGTTVVNYPWDFKTSSQLLHADDTWWQYVSLIYANRAIDNGPNGYFKDETNSGITNGGDWYVITGSRQDYMNYFKHCREMTIEISVSKKLDVNMLNNYWNYNRQAMLDFTEQILYGFSGIITDKCSGNIVSGVKVFIAGHDNYGSEVYSSAPLGNYFRPIYAGTYNVTFSKEGYFSKTQQVTVTNNNMTTVNISLEPKYFSLLLTSYINNESFDGAGDGSIKVTVQGGTPDYEGLWSNGQTSYGNEMTITNLTCGTYSITVSDANNCKDSIKNMQIPFFSGIEETDLSEMQIYPNPTNGIFVIESINNIQEIEIYNMFGTKILSEKPNKNKIYYNLKIDSGTYFIEIKSLENKKIVKKLVVF